MAIHTLTVQLSEQEIAILRAIAAKDKISPNEALKKIILQAGYLREKTTEGKQLFWGDLVAGDKIRGDNIQGVVLK